MNVNKKLKEALKSTGYRFDYIAEKTGIPYDSLIQYLNGHRPIPENKVRLLCLTFDLPLKKFGIFDRDSVQESEASNG